MDEALFFARNGCVVTLAVEWYGGAWHRVRKAAAAIERMQPEVTVRIRKCPLSRTCNLRCGECRRFVKD